jgi:hypothetical protein
MHKTRLQTAVGMLDFGHGRVLDLGQAQAGCHDSEWYQCPTREPALAVGRNELSSYHDPALRAGPLRTGCHVTYHLRDSDRDSRQ